MGLVQDGAYLCMGTMETGMAALKKRSAGAELRAWIERLWSGERGQEPSSPVPEAPPLDRARLLTQALLSERGEASGAAVARELHAAVRELTDGDRLAYMVFLATGFQPDATRLRRAAETYLAEPTPDAAARLAEAADPPRQEVLRRMNLSPGGTASLVALRRDALNALRDHPELKTLDGDLHHLFGSWFNRGFLEMRRIDWQSPAALLEKLITYEAVHEIADWDDLRRRVAPDRRCFGFFHPALPGEPLIFVEVALTEGLAAAVQPLLAPLPDEATSTRAAMGADSAIFYSISNCQEGLRGVSFGNFLIKQVVEDLQAELPHLKQFSTLSPVPGFRRWLDRRFATGAEAGELLTPEERLRLPGPAGDDAAQLASALKTEAWWEDDALSTALEMPLVRQCATYLTGAPGKGADPVARFHLGNGARLERINWLGNTAPRGLRESWGIMVNYLYDLAAIEANHEAFVRDGNVARSANVDALINEPLAAVQPKRARAG
jgi:malonyl-CoA decarboxylase